MSALVDQCVQFFARNTPSIPVIALAGPVALAWAWICLRVAAGLKRRFGWRTGYTRKLFHFAIFGSVAVVESLWGTPIVCLLGGMTSLVVFYAVARGDGHPLYEAMARESDEPHRTYFILAPYAATLFGGLASNILFGPVAIVGYLATGLGDAVGEPVGARYGRHRYRVPSVWGVPATRSLEGSAAVFVACGIALWLAAALSSSLPATELTALAIVGFAAACALLEAVSPHGWDNAVLQVAPTFLAWMYFR